MLIPIIKDFNNAFSYLVSNSVEKTKQVFDPVSKSLLDISGGPSDQFDRFQHLLQIGWTAIRICFLFLVQSIKYIISFQWLRDFAYLPISIPNHILGSNDRNGFIGVPGATKNLVSLVGDRQNVLQKFLFSNQTILKPETNLAVSGSNLPYNNFILGLPNITHSGAPIDSWSLSFLSNKWFDPLTVPVNFLSTGLESGSKNISQLSSLPEQITGDASVSNIILMSILICITTGFSSFLNSFFISFPLSLSNLLSLRYLMIQKFWAGCVSVLGIVFGEIVFMLFLILPTPFIQITLVYLESVWPYILGLSLMIFIIFDLISNPYTNTMSLSSSNNQILSETNSQASRFPFRTWIQFLGWPRLHRNNSVKIFVFSFLLALSEQSCYFSFFGSLNLSSTGNFLDTYLFAASQSPVILFFSCIGFLIGSFSAITIYNLVIAKMIFLVASLGIKIKQYNGYLRNSNFMSNVVLNRQTDQREGTGFNASINSARTGPRSKDSKNDSVSDAKFFILARPRARQIYTSIKNSIMFRSRYLLDFIKSKESFKSLLLALINFVQLFISYLPGGKRIIFFLFPGQAHSYKSDFQTKSFTSGLQTKDTSWTKDRPSRTEANAVKQKTSLLLGFKAEPKGLENRIENMLRSEASISSSSLSGSYKDSSFTNQIQASQFGGSAFYNKIDKVLLTCLITLSFTTIPYYSFDYLINSFFGFIPQDQILNTHSLRVNFPDYTTLLGIPLSDNKNVINTDVSLYDRAHFMYGEWPNSFESLNYQGELIWTNLQDHRRQKRTRGSTRVKFKTLKTKISTSWKEFKRSSGFSGSSPESSFPEETRWDSNFSEDSRINEKNKEGSEKLKRFPVVSNPSQQYDSSTQDSNKSTTRNYSKQPNRREGTGDNHVSSENQKYLRNTNNLSNVFYKIFLASPFKPLNEKQSARTEPRLFSNGFEQQETKPDSSILNNNYNQSNDHTPLGGGKYLSKTFESVSQANAISKNEMVPKIPEEMRPLTSLNEMIQPLSTSTFIDLSGGEKSLKTYPKNWKRVITEKYYQNPIYKTILATDLKNFLKREPLTQQLTNNQENELYFLRVKMAHYYDSLRFYFSLKEQINSTRSTAERREITSKFNSLDHKKDQIQPLISSAPHAPNDKRKPQQSITKNQSEPYFSSLKNQTRDAFVYSQRENNPQRQNTETGVKESLASPPFQFKSMTSMNYRQQFKGTLKTVKQLFAISLPEAVSPFSNSQHEQNSSSEKNYARLRPRRNKESNQSIDPFLESISGASPIEKSYKYDKYLFNEYSYPKNFFLHEEGRGFTNQKLTREPNSQNSTSPLTGTKGNFSARTEQREYETFESPEDGEIELATKNIYNMFGSNDPFYVGWDQNLRKFVLTSRILSRSSALNYNAANSQLNVNKNNSAAPHGPEILDPASNVPIYSSLGSPQSLRPDPAKDLKRLHGSERAEEKKQNFNQQSVHLYRPYTSWPFFKHQLKNLPNRSYFVLYEKYLNIVNKRIHLFRNININDVDTKSLTFLYFYSSNDNRKNFVSQLPINIYKQSMGPSSSENLFTPTSNARSSFLWPGSTMPAWEYYFW